MAGMTNHLETQLLGAVLNGTTYSSPTALYVGLFTSDPTETGSEGTEVSDTAYVRQQVTFDPVTDGTASNTNLIEFATAAIDYGTITHIAILDAVTGGNMLFYQELETSLVVGEGVGIRIAMGDLTIRLD